MTRLSQWEHVCLTVWRQDCVLYKMWEWELHLNPAKNTGQGAVRWRLWLQNIDCWTQGMRYPVIYRSVPRPPLHGRQLRVLMFHAHAVKLLYLLNYDKMEGWKTVDGLQNLNKRQAFKYLHTQGKNHVLSQNIFSTFPPLRHPLTIMN